MRTYKNFTEYAKAYPKETQELLRLMRATIKKVAPKAKETISYGIPTFTLGGNLVHYAAYRQHIGFYPTSSSIKAFKKELAKYKGSRGSVQFPLDKPLPIGLIAKIVKYRVRENAARAEK